jgi:hypothetical protein
VTFPVGVKGQEAAGPPDFTIGKTNVLGGLALAGMGTNAADAMNKARIVEVFM